MRGHDRPKRSVTFAEIRTCASFEHAPAHGGAILEVETDTGDIVRQEVTFPTATPSSSPDRLSSVARVAAAARLKETDDVVGLDTALRYRLVSPWTNWLVVAPRAEEEKSQDIPALRKVPQTLAAGWGGVGSVAMSLGMNALGAPRALYSRPVDFAAMKDFDLSGVEGPRRAVPSVLPEPYRRLIELVDADPSRLNIAGALDLLMEAGLAPELDDLFRHAADLGVSVDVVAVLVLARLLGGPLDKLVSDDSRLAVMSLRKRARDVTGTLRALGDHGIALARLTQEQVACQVLRRSPEDNVQGALEQFAGIQDLLNHLTDALRRQLPKRRSRLPC